MEQLFDNRPTLAILRYFPFKVVCLKFAVLSKKDRQFILSRLPYLFRERPLTVNVDVHNLRRLPRHPLWLSKVPTQVTMIFKNGISYAYAVAVMSQFNPRMLFNLTLDTLTDEDVQAEQFMDYIQKFSVGEVLFKKCTIHLKQT